MNHFTFQKLFQLSCVGLLAGFVATNAGAQFEEEPAALSLREAALRGPAVASILELPRSTPADQLRAVFTLLDLGELDVAQSLWSDFESGGLEDETRAALVRQFGTARFLNLARRETATGLTGARAFAEGCLQAAAQLGRDPARLTKLIEDLASESIETRRAARSDLAVTGDAGATACLEALAKTAAGDNGEQLRTELLLTLAKMRPAVEPILIAAIADGRGQFRRDVVELAGYLHLQDAVPWLAAIAAGADSEPTVVVAAQAALAKMGLSLPVGGDARAVAMSELQRLEAHQHPPEIGQWWTFDTKQNQVAAREVSAAEHQLLSLARLSRLLVELPDAAQIDRQLALIYAYQAALILDQPLTAEAQQMAAALDTQQLNETLHQALDRQQISAAKACATLLGNRGDKLALSTYAGRPSPLAVALAHPNRELRFAALEAVMKIKPQQSFVGASGVSKALWYFASSSGDPQAIVASSVVGSASDWAGQLRGMGYDATPVTTGRQTLLGALNSPRLEILLIDSDIGRPLLREVVFSLRSNPQLAHVPIAVLSSLDNLSRAEQIAAADPWLVATPRPQSAEAMETILNELTELAGQELTNALRTEQATAALTWIAELLENGHPYDELLRDSDSISHTVFNPELTKASLRVLAALGTAGSQQLLVDIASAPTQPVETRGGAGDAFVKSVKQFGKLLTTDEIRRQYDRYNASETADAGTQKILGNLLDVLEKQGNAQSPMTKPQ